MLIFFKIKIGTARYSVLVNMTKSNIRRVFIQIHKVSKRYFCTPDSFQIIEKRSSSVPLFYIRFLIEIIYLFLDGLLYFVEGATIGSDFGFPRLGIRKRFKWKKMNFTTDLPKKDPLVSYIVASAVKCEKFFPGSNDDGPVYRMHAVILKKSDAKL